MPARPTQVWKLPAGVDPLAFAGLVLTQVGYNCGARALLTIGQGAVVIGDGLVGQWAAQTLAWRGAEVVLVGRHADRLAKFATGPMRYKVHAANAAWTAAGARLRDPIASATSLKPLRCHSESPKWAGQAYHGIARCRQSSQKRGPLTLVTYGG